MLLARDLMTENPVTITTQASVRRAVELLQTLEIRHLPVVDEQGALVGMLSDRDLRALSIPYFVADEYVGNIRTALEAKVTSLMNGDVVSVNDEADANEVVELILENKVGAIPVTDAEGDLVGIVSYVDILRALPLEPDEDE